MLMLYFIILLAFFAPGLLIPGLANVWLADIPLLAVLVWRVFSPPRMTVEYRYYMQSKLLLPLFVLAIWLIVITIFTLSASPNVPPLLVLFSFMGRLRPILFLLFCIPYCCDSEKLFKMFKFLIILFVLQCVVVFCQKSNIAGINFWYTPRFRPTDVDITYIYLLGVRTIGSIGNPNSLGTFMSIFAVVGFSVYAFGSGFRRWIGLSMTVITFIVCVFFAGTRQGTLSIIFGCTLISVIAIFIGKIGSLAFAAVMVFFSFPVFLSYLAKNYALFQRFAVLRGTLDLMQVGSVQARLSLWPKFWSAYGGWIFTGKGMAGYISSITWDNGWLMLVVAGGIPLALIYLWWLLRVSSACFKALPYRSNAPELTGFLLAGPATTFIVIIINLVNNTYADTKIAILIGLVYALSLGAAYQLTYVEYAPMELDEQERYLSIQDGSDD